MSQAFARRTFLSVLRSAPRRFNVAQDLQQAPRRFNVAQDLQHTWANTGDIMPSHATSALRHLRVEPNPLAVASPFGLYIRPPPGLTPDAHYGTAAANADIALPQPVADGEHEEGDRLAPADGPRAWSTLSNCSTASDCEANDTFAPPAKQDKDLQQLGDTSYSPGRVFLEAAYTRPFAPPILLHDALPDTEQPPAAVPSVGSAGHHLGLCRPCDFTYRNGSCREGAACRFCHLCGPEVGKRRKKQRRHFLIAMRTNQTGAAAPSRVPSEQY